MKILSLRFLKRCLNRSLVRRTLPSWKSRLAGAGDNLETRCLLSAGTADSFVALSAGDYGPFAVVHSDNQNAAPPQQWTSLFANSPLLQTSGSNQVDVSDEFIAVDSAMSYGISAWAKSGDEFGTRFDAANQQSLGVIAYDSAYQPLGVFPTAVLNQQAVPGDFTYQQYTAVVGFSAAHSTQLPVGTQFLKVLVSSNQQGTISNLITWRDVVVEELPADAQSTAMQQPIIDLTADTPQIDAVGLSSPSPANPFLFAATAERVRIDPDLQYSLSVDSYDLSEHFEHVVGLRSFDNDGALIHSVHVTRYQTAADTVLAQPVNPGDAAIFVQDATGWSNAVGEPAETRSLAWYDYTDGTGVLHDDYTYTRNVAFDFDQGLWAPGAVAFDSGANAWRIDLQSTWNGPAIPNGTAIRNASGSDAVQLLTIATDRRFHEVFNSVRDEIDTFNYRAKIGGEWLNGNVTDSRFRPGTAFVQPVFRYWLGVANVRFGLTRDFDFELPTRTATFDGSRRVVLNRSLQQAQADQTVAIATHQQYRIQAQVATGMIVDGSTPPVEQHSMGYLAYDADGRQIEPQHVSRHPTAVDTTLAAELKFGDGTIVVTDASGWSNAGLPSSRSLAWYDYQDGTGTTHANYSYTRNVAFDPIDGLWDPFAINGNVITLRSPWAGPTIAAGAAIRNASGGDTIVPALIDGQIVANSWTNISRLISGEWTNGVSDPAAFPPATKSVRLAARANETNYLQDDVLQVRGFSIGKAGTAALPTTSDQRAVLDLDVLTNDDLASPTTQIINVTIPAFGAAVVVDSGGPNGEDIIRYTSAPWFIGTDSITYTAEDTSTGNQWTTTASITIAGTNLASDAAAATTISAQGIDAGANAAAPQPVRVGPLLQDLRHVTEAGRTLIANGLPIHTLTDFSEDPDGDVMVVKLTAGVLHGVLNLQFDGTFEYTPFDGFVGSDRFEYTVFDGLHAEHRTASIRVVAANESLLTNRLKDIAVALHTHHDVYQKFPYDPNNATHYDAQGVPHLSWRVHILPYLGYDSLYDQFRFDEPWNSANNLPLLDQMPPVFAAPGDANGITTTRIQLFSDFTDRSGDFLVTESSGRLQMGRIRDIVDGTSNSILAVQSGADVAVPWTAPLDVDFDAVAPFANLGSLPNDRLTTVMADSSVVTLATGTITTSELQSLATKSGREILDAQTLLRRDVSQTSAPRADTIDRAQTESRQIRDLGLALHNFHDVYQTLPVNDVSPYLDASGDPLLSWRVHLLPFLDQGNLYDQFNLDEPWDSPNNLPLLNQMPDIFRSAEDAWDSTDTRIQVFTGPDAPWTTPGSAATYDAPRFRDITDGLANTALIAETGADRSVPWTAPQDIVFDIGDPLAGMGDLSDGRIRLLLADGSRFTVSADIDPAIFSALITHQGQETVGSATVAIREAQRDFNVSGQNLESKHGLKQIALGMFNYHDTFNSFPLPYSSANPNHFDANGVPHLSWRVHILPFIDQVPLYNQFNLDEPWDSANNLPLLEQMPDVFRSLGDRWDTTSTRFQIFRAPYGPFGRVIGGLERGPRLSHFVDGTSNTFLVAEAGVSKAVVWTQPDDLEFDPTDVLGSLGLLATDFLNVAFADGSARQVGLDFSDASIAALVSMNGGEVINQGAGASPFAGFTVQTDSTPVIITEGELGAVEVILDKPGNVQINVTLSRTGVVNSLSATLTFTTANWDIPQTITLEAIDDFLLDNAESVNLTLSINDAASDDEFDSLPDQIVVVTTVDDDWPGIRVTQTAGDTTVSESGTTDTFDVTLAVPPTSNVVLSVTNDATDEITVDATTLTFTPANWNTPQTITVTGVDDSLLDGNQISNVVISVDDAGSDDAFDPAADVTVSVVTTDDDSPSLQITESAGDTTVSEAGTVDSFRVALTIQPDSDVVLNVSSGDNGEVQVNPSSLTFTSADWSTPQTVNVAAVDDAIVDGTRTIAVTVSVDEALSDDAYDPLPDQSINVTSLDNDVAGVAIVETGSDTTVSESGTTDTFSLALTAQPSTDVVLTIVSNDTGEAQVDLGAVTFTNANWDVPQTVTVTGIDDLTVDGDQTISITVSVDDNDSDDTFDPVTDQTLSVTVSDDDSAGFSITETAGSTTVSEAGTTDTFEVVLNRQPVTDVVFNVVSSDPSEVTVDTTALTFTPANWNTAQTVTASAVDDLTVDGSQTTQVTLNINDALSDDAFDALADQFVSVTSLDNDSAGFAIAESGGSTIVSESGTTDTFNIQLTSKPLTDVVLTIVSSDTTEARVDIAAITFTPADWNTAQTITVAGIDDLTVDGDQNATITISVDDSNSDDAFDALPDQTLTVSVSDDDVAGFAVTESGDNTRVSESGTTDTFDVVLTARPLTDVVLTISSSDSGEVVVDLATVTFTRANWNTAQTVTVTGIDDLIADGDQTATITISIDDNNSDDAFDPLSDQTLTVLVTDDDVVGFSVTESGGNTTVSESGTTDTIGIALTSQPLTDVVLDISASTPTEATADLSQLTFSSANWDTPQTVTITGIDDTQPDGPQVSTITISVNPAASDDAFDPIPDQTVSVTTTDDEPGRLDVDANSDANAATDGILIIRYLFGFRDDPLINNALGGSALNDTAAKVVTALLAATGLLDVDGNGTPDAATDGILIIRYLFGFRGDPLVENAIGSGAVRTTGQQVSDYLDGFMPAFGNRSGSSGRQGDGSAPSDDETDRSDKPNNDTPADDKPVNGKRTDGDGRQQNDSADSSPSSQPTSDSSDAGATANSSAGGNSIVIVISGAATGRPTFDWSEQPDADAYRIVVQRQEDGQIVESALTETNQHMSTSLLPAGNYRVWVEAINASGTTTPTLAFADFSIAQSEALTPTLLWYAKGRESFSGLDLWTWDAARPKKTPDPLRNDPASQPSTTAPSAKLIPADRHVSQSSTATQMAAITPEVASTPPKAAEPPVATDTDDLMETWIATGSWIDEN